MLVCVPCLCDSMDKELKGVRENRVSKKKIKPSWILSVYFSSSFINIIIIIIIYLPLILYILLLFLYFFPSFPFSLFSWTAFVTTDKLNLVFLIAKLKLSEISISYYKIETKKVPLKQEIKKKLSCMDVELLISTLLNK